MEKTNIVETLHRLSRENIEVFLTESGWLQYEALLDQWNEQKGKVTEKDGKVYKLITFKGA